MKIIISNRSNTPIYEQIKSQIIEAIHSKEIDENEQLPSIRQLAKDLKISVITTTRAYKDLEDEGYVVNVQGKGCYVLPMNESLNYENTMMKIEDLMMQVFELKNKVKITDSELIRIIDTLMKENHND